MRILSKACAGILWFAISTIATSANAEITYTITDLGTLGGSSSAASSISNSGLITGAAYIAGATEEHAFLYDGTMHDLGTLGGTSSVGYAVNNAGQVVGYSIVGIDAYGINIYHGFLYDGAIHDLGTLGGSFSEAWGINNFRTDHYEWRCFRKWCRWSDPF